MADFCAECSVETFGSDMKDMAGMTTPAHTQRGEFMAALCESCGTTILVDHEGVRMTELKSDIQIVDGEEQSFWMPRPEAEVAAARQHLASLPERPVSDQTIGAPKPAPEPFRGL